MYYPELYTVSKSRDMTAIFGGLNKTHTCTDGEWISEDGLTSQYYPTLCQKRGDYPVILTSLSEDVTGKLLALKYFSNGDRCAVYENGIQWGYWDDFVDHFGSYTPKYTSIIEFGDYALIYPYGIWIQRSKVDADNPLIFRKNYGIIDNTNVARTFKIQLTRLDGSAYEKITASNTAPESPANGDYWLDIGESQWLYYWDGVREEWQSVSTMYIQIYSEGIGAGFNQYDAINIEWSGEEQTLGYIGIEEIAPGLLGSHIIEAVSDDYIIVTGYMRAASIHSAENPDDDMDYSSSMTFSRKTPEMDYVFAHKNRLWGCRYSENHENGQQINEIYASKLGDFKNWNSFEGISTDSWVATVGTGADFTGALVYNDRPTFFKDDRIITITGDIASEFRTSETVCESIGLSGRNSAQVVNGVLYYVSKYGICAYTGGFPTRISDPLGYGVKLTANASAARKDTYCLWADFSDESGTNGEHLIEYDTVKGIWHITKTPEGKYSWNDHNTYFATQDNLGKVHRISGNMSDVDDGYGNYNVFVTDEGEYNRKWFAESGLLTMSYPGAKRVSAFRIRAELAEDAKADFYIRYEDDDEWRLLDTLCGIPDKSIHTFTIRNLPRRCDHYRMRFEGVGKCKIYSICYDIEQGGY